MSQLLMVLVLPLPLPAKLKVPPTSEDIVDSK